MAKYEPKTRPTDASVEDFIDAVQDEKRRADAHRVLEIFKETTKEKPVMWGPSIIGFGSQQLRYASGQELDWPIAAFSPRKATLVLYLMDGFAKYDEHLSKLGKHSTGKSCLYIKRLSDVDEKVLRSLIRDSVAHVRKMARS